MDIEEYNKLKQSRMVAKVSDLPLSIQKDLETFIYFYKPKWIRLHGSYQDGSWVDDLDSDFANIKKSLGRRYRISDCDISINEDCTKIRKYKSLDIVPSIGGVLVYESKK